MSAPLPSPDGFPRDDVLKRLEILLKKLDDEGWHVRANTVWLAIETIKRQLEALQKIAENDGDRLPMYTPQAMQTIAREATEQELKSFWKGVSGVDLKKFTIRATGEDEADDALAEIAEEFEAWRDSTPEYDDEQDPAGSIRAALRRDY